MSYHEFLAYLFDRKSTRDLAIAIAKAVHCTDEVPAHV
jgi:hypothetical protein